MISIRRRLTISLLAASAAAIVLAGGILHVTATDALVEQFDATLTSKAGALAGLLELDGENIEFDDPTKAMPEYAGGPEAEYFVLWFEDGREAKRSASLGESRLPRRAGTLQAPEIWDLDLPDGRAGRAAGIAVPVHPKDAPLVLDRLPSMTIVIARSRAGLDAGLATLATGLLVAATVALLLVWWGVTWSVRRGLSPIRPLSEEVERIDASSLARRVEIHDVPEELAPLAVKLNELLGRLQASFAKERRMTAAMAHQLRTPIAELRTASDIARRWPEDDAIVDEVMATAADVALRMSTTIESVMRYCRLEAGQAEPERQAVPLHALLDELWKPFEKEALERGVRFSNAVPEDAVVESDRGLLGIVFGNLLDNAASFAAPGAIRASSTSGGGSLTLRVANETDQLAPDDLAHLSEPFWRKDAARSDGRHSGLGLTLVASIADVLGGAARFALDGRQFVASIEVPAALPAPSRKGPGSGRQPVQPSRLTLP